MTTQQLQKEAEEAAKEVLRHANEVSKDPEKARKYLESEGVDVDAMVSKGMSAINEILLEQQARQYNWALKGIPGKTKSDYIAEAYKAGYLAASTTTAAEIERLRAIIKDLESENENIKNALGKTYKR